MTKADDVFARAAQRIKDQSKPTPEFLAGFGKLKPVDYEAIEKADREKRWAEFEAE